MKDFFIKLRRIFWSWGFLKFVFWTITLIVLFYVEEDWRGARTWASTKAKWEAQGQSFDVNLLIPPPIPDAENLAAIPLFEQTLDPKTGQLTPIALQKALRADQQPGIELPSLGNWEAGKLPNMERIRMGLSAAYTQAFNAAPPVNPIDQIDALYPFTADLRAAAAIRPNCRFQLDYTSQPPGVRSLSLLTSQIAASRILTLHAILALDTHQPDLAMDDIKVNFKLISGMKRDPRLVSGLISIGMTAISLAAVYDGIALHAWNDAQLAKLQNELAKLDFLEDYQLCMRGEAIGEVVPNMEYVKVREPRLLSTWLGMASGSGGNMLSSLSPSSYSIWPSGWLDLNLSQIVDRDLGSIQNVDPTSHRVFPEKADQLGNEAQHLKDQWYGYAPWNVLFTASAPVILSTASKFAQIQVRIDQARIACAMERYRLAHNTYPDTLDVLIPDSISDLPHDIINGQPYHYQLGPESSFLLYSVGWNGIDDKGKIVYRKDSTTVPDFRQGDLVWPITK